MQRVILAALAAVLLSGEVVAEGFKTLTSESDFVTLVNGKKLTRFGIKLDVTPSGEIRGNAFGREVTGAWRWSNGYFCRDLYYGARDLGPNCQMVQVNGNTMRFISDRGEGIYADLNLR